MAKKSTLSARQRTQLVLRLLSKEVPAAQFVRRADISEQTLYRWREDFINGSQQAMKGRGGQTEQAKQVKRLSAEVVELIIAKRILKNFGRLELNRDLREIIAGLARQRRFG